MKKIWINAYDQQVPANLDYPKITADQFLSQSADKYPNHTCITFQEIQYSYQHVDTLVTSLAAGLQSIGVKKGDRVGLVLGNVPQFIISFYAILRLGAIVVATNPQYKERELVFQLSNAGCRIVIAGDECVPLIRQIQHLTEISTIITTKKDDVKKLGENFLPQIDTSPLVEHDLQYLDLFHPDKRTGVKDEILGEDAAIFQYSGGTTGVPKAAIGLHRNLVANTLQFRNWLFDLKAGQETVLAAIPLYHVYGMVIAMSMGVAIGANLVLVPNPRDISTVLENIEQYKATLFPGVPAMYHAINQHPSVREFDLTSIKACISGSAPLLKEVKEIFELITGGKLLEGYGLSEAPTATHCNPYQGENRTGSIGLPLPDVDCRIVDLVDGKTDVAPGEVGELLVKSPQVMSGYHGLPDETASTLVDGWLHTGDIARMDADGYFYLVDRKKDVIKAGGFQVWPREVEEVIAEHPMVIEAAVAGVIEPGKGELVHAWVVCRPDASLSSEEIRSWCRERLANYKVPAKVEFIAQLPRTTVGKVLRRELVRVFQASQENEK